MRCKHQITIEESGSWGTTHYQNKDGSWWHNQEPGEYKEMLEIECTICKKIWRYSKRNAPQWLKIHLEKLGILL